MGRPLSTSLLGPQLCQGAGPGPPMEERVLHAQATLHTEHLVVFRGRLGELSKTPPLPRPPSVSLAVLEESTARPSLQTRGCSREARHLPPSA